MPKLSRSPCSSIPRRSLTFSDRVIFTEIRFLLLVAVCWATFFAVPAAFRAHALAFWGIIFYAMYAGEFLLLVGGLVVLTYVFSSRQWVWVPVALLVACLGYFKLRGDTPGLAGIIAFPQTSLVLPLGLSFLTFELIHFAVERRRGKITDASLVDLAAFAFFFPCRVAGPIKRYPDFAAGLARAEISAENLHYGTLRIVVGLFKKFALADFLALIEDRVYSASSPLHAWGVVLAYSLQIYLDFSAYSDIAIGLSRLMGIRIPENFRAPYLSSNIQEFWNRWHISLSSWVRDYVFMEVGQPLFKTRLKSRPRVIAAACYMTTFIIVGAWHGLTPNFLLWGLYHGLLLTGYHLYKVWIPIAVARSPLYSSRVATWAGMGLTFFLVTVGWTLFMVDVPKGFGLLRLMFRI